MIGVSLSTQKSSDKMSPHHRVWFYRAGCKVTDDLAQLLI